MPGQMSKKWFMILFFGCFGMTSEIFFVALTHAVNGEGIYNEPVWSLTGKTYVWMFPIYTLIPLIAGPLFQKVGSLHAILRVLIYTTLIFTVEFTSGFLLDQLTGKCPWEYTTGWHVMGYIRLDFTPAWMFFSFIVEWLYKLIDRRFI
ncbi:TPA: hypothetical protein EYO57_10695 [Candidatus Poribacteria bacterium]|nr:hypothetical protein [Flavobacteriales bacterium]HIA12756.1 hypothetical protein [Flavobacteriales bacterium]HIB87650.1 hypothetical protein [Candidatus Poribacteria bacterium]HIO72218.1 hypothetical protein [Flavobacteriales bacterium]